METCSSCYFALLCSECCKNQHNKEFNCKVLMSQSYMIKIQNEQNDNQIYENSNLSFTRCISSEKSRMNSEQLEILKYISSTLVSSQFSKTSDYSSSDDASNYNQSKQSKQSQDKVINEPHSRNYEFKDESNYSSSNKMFDSVSSKSSNISVRRRSNDLDYDSNNSSNVHSDIEVTIEDTRNYSKQSKRYNESDQSQKSTKYKNKNTNSRVRSQSNGLDYDKKNYIRTDSVVKLQNKNEQNDRRSRQKNAKKRNKKLILNNQVNVLAISTMKYRMIRSPGCWIPIFMFINRGSYEDVTILQNVISPGMPYILMVEKNGQVYYKINANQYDMLNNYSLI
ncbi:putative uncharacterized protein DDB_G0282133 [Acyrthosiphon pisum]|uniref:Uncharacterized protein n=1 Tax=Acyrthosiphon pisum TaxID=7029 RepID=A0A8R2JUH3_ACYPI|nr:putative uncharacterized protein DDB_G0282133 [Acyrthosiphon pisum]